jgi:RNA polymerase sigma-70 factor (ECF subfamily)
MTVQGHDANAKDDALEDETIARRVAAGETAAEQELCRRLLPRVRAWGLKHLRDEALALDLSQQVLLAVLEALREGRIEQLDRLGPYVLGVCKNTVFAWNRGNRRREALLERFGPSFENVVRIDETALDQRRLGGCWDLLAPRARALLALTFFAERSGEEIAGELGVSPENVRVMRHRAMKLLHECMTGGA